MGSPVDVVPGEIIEAEWGNTIRDQSISRWPDATARDVGIPTPEPGKVVWLSNPGVLEVYDGAEWVEYIDQRGGQVIAGTLGARRFEVDIPTIGDALSVEGDPAGTYGKQVGGIGIQFSSRVFTIWGGSEGNTANNSPNINLSTEADGTPRAISFNARDGVINVTAGQGAIFPGQQKSIIIDNTAARTVYIGRDGAPFAMWHGEPNADDPSDPNYRVRVAFGYGTLTGSSSYTLRDILVGTTVPDNAWGKDGDVYIRYQ